MNRLARTLLLGALFVVAGCGGGGGGGNGGGITLSGTVLAVGTGLPTNPAATVVAGGASGQTKLSDGTFAISVPVGTSSVAVSATGFQTISYTFAPLSGSRDIGFLFIGPQVIRVTGKVVNSQDSSIVAGASVAFLAQTTATDSSGTFDLPTVAYDPNGLVQLVMHVEKAGFIPRDVPINDPVIGGVMNVADIQLAPESDPNPPPGPANIYGFVGPANDGSAVLVTLVKRSDQSIVSQFVTGTLINGPGNEFVFWVPAGQYTLKFEKPFGTSRGQTDVDLVDVGTPVRKDFTLQ